MVLVIIDCYCKWVEAFVVASADSQITIEKFRECFARFGLPNTVVTDNGTQFVSAEFSKFLSTNGIKHLTSPPFHPVTNGFAENAVKSAKLWLKKALLDSVNKDVSLVTTIY